jgi:hypothetical protein
MGEKIVVGPMDKGIRKDVTPFNIDNQSFLNLINAYQQRGRIKRKRGTSTLGRLNRQFDVQSIGNSGASPWTFNLFSFLNPSIATQEPNASLVLGSVQVFINPAIITNTITGYTVASDCEVFTPSTAGLQTGDQVTISGVVVVAGTGPATINGGPYKIEVISATSFKLGTSSQTWGQWSSGGNWATANTGTIEFNDQGDGTLTSTTPGNSGTVNYATGSVTLIHTAGAGIPTNATFSYYPSLPVMGLEDLELIPTQFPGTLAFDTRYSYEISTANPYEISDVTYYKNPPSGTYPGYIAKTSPTAFTWNGENYQQFWTVNDQGALFATNGIRIPFNISNIGMQFKAITGVTIGAAGPPALINLTIVAHGLVVGDFVFVNEVIGITGINFQTGYVTVVVDANTVTVEFPNATIAGAYVSGGITQYLTNTVFPTKDCIKWYDGNPDNGGLGWVNFCPPLSQRPYSIAELPAAQYYLVGARIIMDFKDRLLFLGPVIQNSSGGVFYLQDTVIYSQNGTPYYTASFTGNVDASTTVFTPILVPINQTATASSWFEDDTGFGGFISAGLSQPLTTCSSNEDVLIVGFSTTKSRLIYTGNDLVPFLFYTINSELGDASTFSVVDLDKGVMTRGTRGYLIASQTQVQRFDLEIPDQVFQIDLTDNGNERFTAGRNFIQEWIYFTYNSNNAAEGISNVAVFPNQSLFYNYRDNSWAIFNESYTTYGQFRKQTGFTWQTVGLTYASWDEWNDAWNAGTSTLLQELLIAGNQQGFVMIRDVGTSEGKSLYIKSFSSVANLVTSPDHNLNNNDYIILSDALGTVGPLVNGKVFQVFDVTRNSFRLSPDPMITSETYLGGCLITAIYVPFIQTKQFPVAWDMGRKTRLGPQQYLFTTTDNAQVTLQIYLSQNSTEPYNLPPIPPDSFSTNNSLIYSQVLYTCPENTNLGLTPANINLQSPTAMQQAQTWHRMNTSLIGDTVQIGFTLSDAQIRDLEVGNATAEIEFHGMILDVSPSALLC